MDVLVAGERGHRTGVAAALVKAVAGGDHLRGAHHLQALLAAVVDVQAECRWLPHHSPLAASQSLML